MSHTEAVVYSVGCSRHTQSFVSGRTPSPILTYLIRLQVNGSCQASVNGEVYTIRPGDLLLLKPGDDYLLRIDAETNESRDGIQIESTDYYLSCGGPWLDAWWSSGQFRPCTRITLDEGILSQWRSLIYEKRNIYERNEELTDYLLRALLLSLERLVRRAAPGREPRGGSYVPYRIKEYIERHAIEPLTLEGIAREAGISVSSAAHLFKAAFGQSIMRYVVDVRLSVAAERMLQSGLKLEEIAEASGFVSYPYFCRSFRTRFGASPSEYRLRNQLQ